MDRGQEGFCERAARGPLRPLVVSSPHSGAVYPAELVEALAVDADHLRALEDGPTDALVAGCVETGATVLAATFARAYVDLNRAPLELDPQLLGAAGIGARLDASPKVQAGLGVVPSRLGTMALYRSPPGAALLRARLERAYLPYHRRLRELLRDRVARFGAVLLLDCHSMPVEAAGVGRATVEIAVGDRFGASCGRGLVELALDTLAAHGLKVARNRPYAGGFIIEHHGRPAEGRHAIQLEIRRDLFMDQRSYRANAGAARIAAALVDLARRAGEQVMAQAHALDRPQLEPAPAAELHVPELLRAAD